MRQRDLDRAVARRTGESVATIQRYGFQLLVIPGRQPLVMDWDSQAEARPIRRRASRARQHGS